LLDAPEADAQSVRHAVGELAAEAVPYIPSSLIFASM
jgi:hypothetical protein